MKKQYENIEKHTLGRLLNFAFRTWRKTKPEKGQRALDLGAYLKRDIGIETMAEEDVHIINIEAFKGFVDRFDDVFA